MSAEKKTVYCDGKDEDGELCKQPAFWKCQSCGRPVCSKHAFENGAPVCYCGKPDYKRCG